MNKHKKATIAMIVTAAGLLFTACSSTKYYTADDIVNVSVSGSDGNGTANVMIDRNAIMDKINNDVYKGDGDEVELAKAELMLYEYVKISADNTEKLSNGDKVTITLDYDNDALKEAGIGVDKNSDTYIYTVEGLEETKTLDLFADVSLAIEGISPHLTAKAEYTGTDDFIKNNVRYTLDKSTDISNDDKIHVTAVYNENTFENNNYAADVSEKDYEISGYDAYADSETDFTDAAKYLNKFAKELLNDGSKPYSVGYEKDARVFLPDGSPYELWKVVENSVTPVKAVLYTNASSPYNSYDVFYRIDMTIEKTGYQAIRPKTEYKDGDREKSTIYFCVSLNGVVEKADGSISFDENDKKIITYSTSLMSNYVGADLEEVAEARNQEKKYSEHCDMTFITED